MIANRRNEVRTRVFHHGSAVFNGRQSVMACTIRNWSQTGALVRMSDWIALPDTFELAVTDRGETLRVRQCWRRGDDVGVAFVNAADEAPCSVVSLAQARAQRA